VVEILRVLRMELSTLVSMCSCPNSFALNIDFRTQHCGRLFLIIECKVVFSKRSARLYFLERSARGAFTI
jgi:hypothetical protein